MNNHSIGVFDSGLGVLTTVKQLKDIVPGESIIYFGDTGRVPYGTRSKDCLLYTSPWMAAPLATHSSGLMPL